MSAAIGTAELAVTSGAYKIPAGTTAEQVSGMIALGYGVTLYLGHGRHHPDLQVPAEVVGC